MVAAVIALRRGEDRRTMAIVPAVARTSSHDTTFGKFRLIASLGHGGMADVYLAVVDGRGGGGELQVIKWLRQELSGSTGHRAMFLDEARLAVRLDHPNVVQTFEVGEERGEQYLAMEYLEGTPLNRIASRARSKPAPPGVLLRVVADALAGLHHAHELRDHDGSALGIVHSDASPHNIFVTYEGHTKIVDFGIATAAARANEPRSRVLTGKVGYMAPEQARCLPLDRRADVFVLGVVLWEVLAGRKMWDRQSDMEILHRLVDGDLPRLREVRPDTPEALARICARALAREPADRYASAAEMRREILAYMNEAGLHVSSEDVGRYVSELFADQQEKIRGVIAQQQHGRLATPFEGALAWHYVALGTTVLVAAVAVFTALQSRPFAPMPPDAPSATAHTR
jgi:serine/threonine-protein kinase